MRNYKHKRILYFSKYIYKFSSSFCFKGKEKNSFSFIYKIIILRWNYYIYHYLFYNIEKSYYYFIYRRRFITNNKRNFWSIDRIRVRKFSMYYVGDAIYRMINFREIGSRAVRLNDDSFSSPLLVSTTYTVLSTDSSK